MGGSAGGPRFALFGPEAPEGGDLLAMSNSNRAAALIGLERNEEAIADATIAIQLEPEGKDLARAHLIKGVALGLLGRPGEAILELETVLELLPGGHPLSEAAIDELAKLPSK